jgi:quinol monooxygenase YgiN
MHAAIRQGKVKSLQREELVRLVRNEVLPRVKALRGFKAFHFVVSDDGSITVLNLFTDAAAAEESNATMLPWIREHLGPLLDGPPSGTTGAVLVSDGSET